MQEWFIWDNKTLIQDHVYVLHDFLQPDIYDQLKHEIRTAPNEWHNRYASRLIAENVRSPMVMELGARLLPYLSSLFHQQFCVATAKIYIDLSGSSMFPHFDDRNFAVSMQLYMPDVDCPELGTKFCFNNQLNQLIENEPDRLLDYKFQMTSDSDCSSPVAFCSNNGYINFNNKPVRTLHKTLPVPAGYIRESLHYNFNIKQQHLLGLEGVHYARLQQQEASKS
jgi:hypothetical protein